MEAHIDLLLCFQDNVTLFEIAKLYECPQTVMCKVIKLEKELTNSHKGANTSYLNSIEQTITTLRKYYKECNGKVTDTQLEPISRLQKDFMNIMRDNYSYQNVSFFIILKLIREGINLGTRNIYKLASHSDVKNSIFIESKYGTSHLIIIIGCILLCLEKTNL